MSNRARFSRKNKVGILLIVLSLGLFAFWELGGRALLLYPQVLVLTQDSCRGAAVDAAQLSTARVDGERRGALSPADLSKLQGMVTNQYIKAGEPLYWEYFQEKDMTTADGQGKYIFALAEDWLESYPQSLRRGDTAYLYSAGQFVTDAKVAFVKDHDNNEVVSPDKERLGASASVSAVEIIVSDEQASIISQLAEEGGRFVILYN